VKRHLLIALFVIMAIAMEESLVGHRRVPYPWQIPWNVPLLVLPSTAIFWWPALRRAHRWALLAAFVVAWAVVSGALNGHFAQRSSALGGGSVFLGGLEIMGISIAMFAANIVVYLGLIWLVAKAIDLMCRRGRRDVAVG
jgi:hypothetical protein